MPNRLARAASPYLRQHAGNPVDWWPWCEEALATARREGRPILLSIGYTACHWCHVMAHESFEDDATAAVMNALYVNIKVDREERPDLDKVYQLAHQALAGRGGGWPLTVFLAPESLVPIYAGTYFPKTPRYGMPAFVEVLRGVHRWYDEKPAEVQAQGDALAAFLAEHGQAEAHAGELDEAPIRLALQRIRASFDAENGGHRGAPKFPHASELELLLELGDGASDMARLTLQRMAERGLFDHLAGGFFRYSVDAAWIIPHFEKMLYDNALLLPLYARAGRGFNDEGLGAAARATADWLLQEMTAADGGFWSSLDADSEGEEGRYYVWQRAEIAALLDAGEYAVVERRFDLDSPPNFEKHAWHLAAGEDFPTIAGELGHALADVHGRWDSARRKLLAARGKRVRPGLDDKILTAWNALAIAGAARAARVQAGLADLLAAAGRALDALHANCWKNGQLHAVRAGGEAYQPAFLDDHAFLLDALLAMLQARWSGRDLDWALALADTLLERFEDTAQGGFFFTAHDAEALPQRPRPWLDESLPSGNGVAACALLRLGHLVGEPRYLDGAERTLRAAWPTLSAHPEACCALLLALRDLLAPPMHLVIRADDDEAERWRPALTGLDGRAEVYLIPPSAGALPAILAAQAHHAGGAAYLCRGTACEPPITEPTMLQHVIAAP
ncbi:MAG: thioredoxin domain-containing protein [Xanthomonadales bacterium]|nr:thioredoxin domain-containing protein [Xanthomonadales bacterium]